MHTTTICFLLLAPVALFLTACDSTAPRPLQRINLYDDVGSAAASASPGIVADLIVTGTAARCASRQRQMTLVARQAGRATRACAAGDNEREHADSNETAADSNETDADSSDGDNN